jgi:acyl-coenzyme A synthetase/AMP-(fatty) acid ligase
MTGGTGPTVSALLARHLARGAARPLVVGPAGAAPGEEVARRAAAVAAWLRAAGVARGARVMIDLVNGPEAAAALFGVADHGAITVAGSTHWTPAQVEHVLADSGAAALITSAPRARQLGARCPALVLAGDPPLAGAAPDPAGVGASDPAILIYTSGSTGRPKGVVHPHGNLVAFGEIVARYLALSDRDRLLWALGWSFGYGLSQLLATCVAGGCVIAPATVMPADLCKAHDAHGATGLAHVPYGWEQLVAHLERTGRALTGLRCVTSAGDGLPLPLLARMERALPGARIVLMYGQTECLRTTYLPAEQLAAKPGALGYPIPGVEVRVIDERGRPCGVDEPGELHHVGALVASGYWNDPAATAQRFRREGDRRALATGDVVRRDADGCLWYVARSELMIKSAGFRFGPREIEDAIAACPGVAAAAVFAVPDAVLGQAVEAAVVSASAGAPDAGAPDAEIARVLAHLRQRLPRYMVPRRIHVVDRLPRTDRGKLDRAALRALAERPG